MEPIRLFSIIFWIALPTVMFGGYGLLRRLIRGDVLTPFQVTYFRAGHAHAGLLLVLSFAYYVYLARIALPEPLKLAACLALFVGILAQSGGFVLHMGVGGPDRPSAGTRLTMIGALVLALAVLLLVVGLVALPV